MFDGTKKLHVNLPKLWLSGKVVIMRKKSKLRGHGFAPHHPGKPL
jgi:hypothetical protein